MGSSSPAPASATVKQPAAIPSSASSDLLGLQAEFGDFTSASTPAPAAANNTNSSASSDLFGAMSRPTAAASADPGKMSTDSIMALFGPASSAPRFPQSAPQNSYQTPPQSAFGGLGQASFPAAAHQHLPNNMQGF